MVFWPDLQLLVSLLEPFRHDAVYAADFSPVEFHMALTDSTLDRAADGYDARPLAGMHSYLVACTAA